MEDAHGMWMSPAIGVFGVFDGHAGRACSQYMSREFPPLVAAAGPHVDLPTLEQLCLDLDERFLVTMNDDSGCTAAFCTAIPNPDETLTLHIGNIGDARVLVGRGRSVFFATEDHKPTLPGEAKRVQQCGGWVDFGSGRIDGLLAVSRAFGDRRFKAGGPIPLQQKVIAQPALSTVRCRTDDFLVIACDGIFERDFRNDEVIQFVADALMQTKDPGVACAALCEEALRRGSGDNMTAMVVLFREGSGRQVIALPPPYIVGDAALAHAFEAYAREAELSIAEALMTRWDLLVEQVSEPAVRVYPPELIQGMHAELSFFGQAPGCDVPRPLREGWFRRLAAFYEAARANPHDPQAPDPRYEDLDEGELDGLLQTPVKRKFSVPGHQIAILPPKGKAIPTGSPESPMPSGLFQNRAPAPKAAPNPVIRPQEHPDSSAYIPRTAGPTRLRDVYDSES